VNINKKRPESNNSSNSDNFNATQLTVVQKPKLEQSNLNKDILFEIKDKSYTKTHSEFNQLESIEKNDSKKLDLTMKNVDTLKRVKPD
jgi:hypothetical protein